MHNVTVQAEEVKKEVSLEALKEKILAAIGYEIVYAMKTFNDDDRIKLEEALNADSYVLERILTLLDTLNIIDGECDNYPRW